MSAHILSLALAQQRAGIDREHELNRQTCIAAQLGSTRDPELPARSRRPHARSRAPDHGAEVEPTHKNIQRCILTPNIQRCILST